MGSRGTPQVPRKERRMDVPHHGASAGKYRSTDSKAKSPKNWKQNASGCAVDSPLQSGTPLVSAKSMIPKWTLKSVVTSRYSLQTPLLSLIEEYKQSSQKIALVKDLMEEVRNQVVESSRETNTRAIAEKALPTAPNDSDRSRGMKRRRLETVEYGNDTSSSASAKKLRVNDLKAKRCDDGSRLVLKKPVGFVIGINEISRLCEQGQMGIVLVWYEKITRVLVSHIMGLCYVHNTPLVFFPSSVQSIRFEHMKQLCTVIGIRKDAVEAYPRIADKVKLCKVNLNYEWLPTLAHAP